MVEKVPHLITKTIAQSAHGRFTPFHLDSEALSFPAICLHRSNAQMRTAFTLNAE
jgi:hypothetical protein